ncbi:MAG: MerR family transcriptional regulator [Lachnospiraceae bacterium]|nr:MerR family transcriptional regulator [Lachnospiraceae bacterium]
MTYTIGEIAKMYHLSIPTLRYYDSEGLFPFSKRDEHGNRYFEEKDLHLITSICCLKDSNMPLKEIRRYITLYMEGKSTLKERYQIFHAHKEKLANQMRQLEESMKVMEQTMDNYAKAIEEYSHSEEYIQDTANQHIGDPSRLTNCLYMNRENFLGYAPNMDMSK